MNEARMFLILGIWVAILPYLGFPHFIKNILFTIAGLILIYFSYRMYRSNKTGEIEEKSFDNFSENTSFDEQNVS